MEPAGPARVERRLAAILGADVAGYSRVIEANEEGPPPTQGAPRRGHRSEDRRPSRPLNHKMLNHWPVRI